MQGLSAEIARHSRTDSRVLGREVVNDCKLGEKKNVNVPGCMQHLILEHIVSSHGKKSSAWLDLAKTHNIFLLFFVRREG